MRTLPTTAVLVVLVLPFVGWLGLPSPWALRWIEPDRTSFMSYRLREARRAGDTLTLQHTPVPLEAMAPSLVRAVLSSEDQRFREHGGVDWRALADEVRYAGDVDDFSWTDAADRSALVEALRYALANRSEIRGRSTLTQQLAKNLFFTPDRSLARKAMEMVVAGRLEFWLPKDRILELYLNSVELGRGVFGVEAGARHHFGVSAAELTPFQAASLAATLPHPLTSNPSHRPGRMAWRRDLILRRLRGEDVVIPQAPEPVAVDLEPLPLDLNVTPSPVPLPEGDSVAAVGGAAEGGPGSVDAVVPPADTLVPSTDTLVPPPDTLVPPPDTVGSPPDTLGAGADPGVAPSRSSTPGRLLAAHSIRARAARSTFPDPSRGSASIRRTVLGTL